VLVVVELDGVCAEVEVSWAGMKMPWVASAACWRKTVEFWDEDEGEGEGEVG